MGRVWVGRGQMHRVLGTLSEWLRQAGALQLQVSLAAAMAGTVSTVSAILRVFTCNFMYGCTTDAHTVHHAVHHHASAFE